MKAGDAAKHLLITGQHLATNIIQPRMPVVQRLRYQGVHVALHSLSRVSSRQEESIAARANPQNQLQVIPKNSFYNSPWHSAPPGTRTMSGTCRERPLGAQGKTGTSPQVASLRRPEAEENSVSLLLQYGSLT